MASLLGVSAHLYRNAGTDLHPVWVAVAEPGGGAAPEDRPEAAAFEAAVRADPGDDTVRLAFADWLEEHGRPARAAFVRLQIGRAAAGADGYGGEAEALAAAAFGESSAWWAGPGDPLRGAYPRRAIAPGGEPTVVCSGKGRTPEVRLEFRRGFVDGVVAAWRDWAEYGDRLAALHPVRRVRLVTPPPLVSAPDPAGRPGCLILGDGVHFADVLVGAEAARDPDGPSAVRAVCRLRWPNIEFAVDEPDPVEVSIRTTRSPVELGRLRGAVNAAQVFGFAPRSLVLQDVRAVRVSDGCTQWLVDLVFAPHADVGPAARSRPATDFRALL